MKNQLWHKILKKMLQLTQLYNSDFTEKGIQYIY